jgi:diguanylate cyclase (GGDEF)-like protein
MLKNFGRFLLDQTRGSDVPVRIGGDEFAIILPDTPLSQANTLMTRLAKRLTGTNLIDRNELTLRVEASFGCAGFPETAENVDELIQQADSAMYVVKHERKISGNTETRDEGGIRVPHAFRRLENEVS